MSIFFRSFFPFFILSGHLLSPLVFCFSQAAACLWDDPSLPRCRLDGHHLSVCLIWRCCFSSSKHNPGFYLTYMNHRTAHGDNIHLLMLGILHYRLANGNTLSLVIAFSMPSWARYQSVCFHTKLPKRVSGRVKYIIQCNFGREHSCLNFRNGLRNKCCIKYFFTCRKKTNGGKIYRFEMSSLLTCFSQWRCFGTEFFVFLCEWWSVKQLNVYKAMLSAAMRDDVIIVANIQYRCPCSTDTSQSFSFYWTHSNEHKKLELSVRRKYDHLFARNTKPCLRQVFCLLSLGKCMANASASSGPVSQTCHRAGPRNSMFHLLPMHSSQWNLLERYCLSCEWQIALSSVK